MPNNIKSFIRKELKSLTDQATGKVKGKPKNKAGNKLYRDLKRNGSPDNVADAEQVIAGPMADIHAQLSRRLLELLSTGTPVRTGKLNGGWTTGSREITDRFNKSNFPIQEEIARIFRRAQDGHEVDIRNGVDYALFVNYGTSKIAPRAFFEMAIKQLQSEAASMGVTVRLIGTQ